MSVRYFCQIVWALPMILFSQTDSSLVKRVLPEYSWERSSFDVTNQDTCLHAFQHTFLNVRTPLTILHARFGQHNEQYFSGLHSQNINPRSNFTVQILRTNGEGIYLRQKFFKERYNLGFYLRPKKNRYALVLSANYASQKQEENGGIEDVSLFTENVFPNRKLIPVVLQNASSKKRQRSVSLDQYFFLSKDTVWENKRKGAQLKVGFSAVDRYRTYADDATDPVYYPNIFMDSTRTRDSLSVSALNADIVLKIPVKKWTLEATGLWQWNDHYNLGFDSIMMDLGAGGVLRRDTSIVLKGIYILDGPSAGNSSLSLYVSDMVKSLGKDSAKIGIGFLAVSSSTLSSVFYSYYHSNHYSWYNKLSKEFSRQTHLKLQTILTFRTLQTRFKISYEQWEGYTYLNKDASPSWNNSISWIDANLRTKFQLKNWHFELGGQGRITEDTLLPVPHIQAQFNIFWEKKFTGKKIALQLGGSGNYLGPYFPGTYLPALGMFALDHRFKAGDYLYPAAYVHLLVGPASVYVRADHVTAGLFGYDYFSAEGYPGPDRVVRVGVKWVFYD